MVMESHAAREYTLNTMEHTLRFWIKRDLGRFTDVDKLFRSYTVENNRGFLCLWTSKNRYQITFRPADVVTHRNEGYLGCGVSNRKWRAGEDWHRGRDLPDGSFTETTWRNILLDIVSYELESPVAYVEPAVTPPITNPSEFRNTLEFLQDMQTIEHNIPPIPNLEEGPKT